MVGYLVDPFVQGRVQFRYNVLFPLLANESQKDLRLVDRVLCHIISAWKIHREKETNNRSMSKRKNVIKFDEAIKIR